MFTIYLIIVFTIVILVRAFIEEFWTIIQIFKGLFAKTPNLKVRYGTWAVITGCTDGIGKAFAFELANRGLNIVLISRNKVKLENVASEITKKYDVHTKIIVADLSKGKEIYSVIKSDLKDLDVGILINNAGIQYSYPMYFKELPEEELWSLLNINVGATLQLTRLILPKMIENNRGAIINLSSGSKLQPLPFMNLYAASKIFIDYFTEGLRSECGNKNITVQCLCPYYVSTKINHFNSKLMQVNMFIPSPQRYVESALDTLGLIDNTTGYWPHRLQYFVLYLIPTWIKTYFSGLMYKSMRKNYLKSKEALNFSSSKLSTD